MISNVVKAHFMRKIYSIAFIGFVSIGAMAQKTKDQPDSTLKLEDLQLTNAPGFSLMDVSPSSIERPSTTRAFAASIVNAIGQSNGIPQNYAVEFTPFWFLKHPHLSPLKYYGLKKDGGSRPFAALGLFSVSFALINNPGATVNNIAAHNASLGLRTTLIKVYKKKTRDNILRTNTQWVEALRRLFQKTPPPMRPTQHYIDSLEKAMMDAKGNAVSYGDTIKSYLQDKPVFSLDGASALNLAFTNNNYSSNRLNRYGIWLNANLSLDISGKNNGGGKNYFNLYAIGRYLNNSDSLSADGKYVNVGFMDYGAKAELEFNRLSLAYEYIRRTSSQAGVPNTFKSVGLLKYKIKDGLYLTGAFGQNFTKNNNLIATLGINWGLSNGNEKLTGGSPGRN